MGKMNGFRLAILGAGPIGLEAALYAHHLQLPFTVFERGRVGEHIQRWGHVKLFSPFGMNVSPLGLSAIRNENPKREFPGDASCITGREHVDSYLDPLAKSGVLREHIRQDTQVLSISREGYLKNDMPGGDRRSREPFRILLRVNKTQERVEEADVVMNCTGTYGQHS
jgi:thioredoxin reductase